MSRESVQFGRVCTDTPGTRDDGSMHCTCWQKGWGRCCGCGIDTVPDDGGKAGHTPYGPYPAIPLQTRRSAREILSPFLDWGGRTQPLQPKE